MKQRIHESYGVHAIAPMTIKKNFKSLSEVKAEIIALRKAQGLPPLEDGEPKTLSAAKEMLASMKRPSKPSVRQSVATVAKLTGASVGDPDALADIQSQLDAVTSPAEAAALLQKHADSYLILAQKARAERDYAKEAELLRVRARIEKRHAYALLEQGPRELQKAFRTFPKL
jgi:hypothetical protein